MATKKITGEIKEKEPIMAEPTSNEYWEELVPYTIPFDRANNDDVFVCVNGKSFQIQRGVEVEIPRNVKAVLEQSYKQDIDTWRMSQRMENDFLNAAERHGL